MEFKKKKKKNPSPDGCIAIYEEHLTEKYISYQAAFSRSTWQICVTSLNPLLNLRREFFLNL